MGSRTIRSWLLAVIIIAPAGRILGTDSPKVPTNVAYVSEEDGGISVIDLSTLKVIRRVQPSDLAPMVPGGGVEPPRAEARRILSSQVSSEAL
jgi:hypothetical protein